MSSEDSNNSLEQFSDTVDDISDAVDNDLLKAILKVGKTLYNKYQANQEYQQLWQSVGNFLEQGEYEKALYLLAQLIQRFPDDKARSLYLSACCYFKLSRRDEALQACESAIQSCSDKELLQNIHDLKAKIKASHPLERLKKWYQGWGQDQANQEYQKLRQPAFNFFDQGDYEKALPLFQQLTQKFPGDKARSLYLSAWCYFKLNRRDEALQACESAIQSCSDEKLIKEISILKAKIKFGFGFWIQWLVITVVVGIISLFGTAGFLGEQYNNSTAEFLEFLSMGISIGLAQWFLTRLRIRVGILSLIVNIVAILVIFTISGILFGVNVWLGLLSLIGCMVVFTTLSIVYLTQSVT